MRSKEPAFNLRMPDQLKLKLKASAAENGRSLNKEILFRLGKSFEDYRLDRVQR